MQVEDFLTDTGDWQCTKCGACCKLMHLVPELQFLDRGDSVCVHLGNNKMCSIYDSRPDRCRVELTLGDDFEPLQVAKVCYQVACASMGYHKEVR